MPFAASFQIYPLVERLLRVLQNPPVAYGFVLAMVALTVFVRWLVGEYVGELIPFITLVPTILIATLVSGLWPGSLARKRPCRFFEKVE